jgi:uncharacterized alkaline shock family protein YloU
MEVNPVPEDRAMAPADGPDDARLPCGVPVDELLAQVAERRRPRDPVHQRGCPHCRAALAELDEIWAPVHELADEEVHAPSGLLETVMARVRELSRNPWYAVVPGSVGGTRIAARVVGAVARLAAQSVPYVAVAVGRGRALPDDAERVAGEEGQAATSIGLAGTHVVVDIDIAVDYGVPIPQVAHLVREHIRRDLRQHTGLTTIEVNITVVDVRLP